MKASPRRSIHFTAAVLAVTVIFIITSVFFLYGVIDKVNGKTDDVVYAATCQKSEYINKYIESNFSFLKSIAVSMENYRTTELTLIKQRLKTLTQSSKFLNIIVIDENGNAISYRDEKINIESREYYKKAMNGETFLSEPIFSRPDMAMANVYAVPIYGDYQKVIGVVAAICDKNDLAAVLDMEVSGTDSTFPGCLVDVDGSITAKGNISKELIDDSFFTSGFMDGVSNEEAEALKSDFLKKDFVGIVRSQQPDGTAYFAFCSDLAADSNSHYVVVFPEEDVYQNLHGYVDKVVLMFIFFFAVILLMIGAYFFIVRSSIKTLKSANEEVSRLAYVDELTGYSTWSRFSLDAKRLLAHEYRRYVFVSFDIDKFKAINDMFGHDEGNRILKLIADTVNRNMNDGEIFQGLIPTTST